MNSIYPSPVKFKSHCFLSPGNINFFRILGIVMIGEVIISQLIRFNQFPQFMDDYYHLLVAQSFIKSGGWCGWSFWDYAPYGRPNLYPPLYHLLIAFLIKAGLKPLIALRVLGVFIPLIFFITVYKVLNNFFNLRVASLGVLFLYSTFSFYVSLAAYLPATLGLSFSLLSLFFLKQRKFYPAFLFLSFSFYTHLGIFLSFFFALIFFAFSEKRLRFPILKILGFTLLTGSPFIFHCLRYINFVRIESLPQDKFMVYTPFIIFSGLLGAGLIFTKKEWVKFFVFLLLTFSLVFFKYPYRIFSAQGLFIFCLLSVLVIDWFLKKISSSPILKNSILGIIFIYIFFFNGAYLSGINRGGFKLFFSTFFEYVSGDFINFLEFKSLFSAVLWKPIIKVTDQVTEDTDIVSSNNPLVSVMVAGLIKRAVSTSLLREISSEKEENPYRDARVIIWLKYEKVEKDPFQAHKEEIKRILYARLFRWKKIFENEIAIVYLNPSFRRIRVLRSPFKFSFIFLGAGLVLGILGRAVFFKRVI